MDILKNINIESYKELYIDEMPDKIKDLYFNYISDKDMRHIVYNYKSHELINNNWNLLRDLNDKNIFSSYINTNNFFRNNNKCVRAFINTYIEMGRYYYGLYNINTHKCFIIELGGANGYEQNQNNINILNFDFTSIDENKLFTIDEILNLRYDELDIFNVKLN